MISVIKKMFRVVLLSLTTLTVFSFQEVSAKELMNLIWPVELVAITASVLFWNIAEEI